MKKICILILLTIHLFGNTIEIAKDLFENKQQYKEAIEIFQKYKDDPESQYYIGKAYYYGMGVDKDSKKAFEYAKKSADKNNSSGLNLLGVIYQYGEGIEKDESQALVYYKQAANLGNKKAMTNLFHTYVDDISSITKDYKEALYWIEKAYDAGDIDAAYFIGIIYQELKNLEKAKKYLEVIISNKKSSLIPLSHKILGDIYMDEKNYKKSYYNYKKSAEMGNKESILELIYKAKKFKGNLSEQELLYWMKKGVELKLDMAYLPLSMYYQEKEDYKNLELFLEKSYYVDKNLQMGCNLSSYYLNLMNNQLDNTDFSKAYDIASQIVDKNPSHKQVYICYSNLSYMYEKGNYLAKDLKKAIDIRKKSSEVSENFAKEGDLEYIGEKELELKNSLKLFEKINIKDEKVFPILNNFTKKEQVTAVLETKNFFFFSVSDKSIKMYDKHNLLLLKEFRPWISSGLEGNPLQMIFDENRNILYFSIFNSIKDISKNDLIHGIDINSGKIVKTLKNIIAFKNAYLSISDDGKFIVAINNNNLINIINTENNEIQHYNLGDPIILLAANIVKEKDDYIVSIVNSNKKLYKFSIKLARNISIEDFNFQTNFRSFNGTYAEKIFENKNNITIENAKINSEDNLELKINNKYKEFDLKNFIFKEQDKSIISDNKSSSSLSINQKYDGKVIEFVNRKTKNKKEYFLVGDVKLLNSYPIKDKYILLITSDITFIPILNDKGEIIANLQGFSAFPKNIDIKDNKLVYLGLNDVIHSFNLDILNKLKYVENEFDKEALEGFSSQLGDDKDTIIKNFQSFEEGELEYFRNKYNLSFTPTQEQIKNSFQLFMHKKEIIYPQLSLYIQNENDWILYTPEGLFTYGGNGKDLLKYHQNQGLYKEAKIVDNEKLYEKFYRPDLIKRILAGEKINVPFDIKSVILNINPPELKIIENEMLNERDINLTYQICDAGSGISEPKLIINGQAINTSNSRGFNIDKIDKKENKCNVYKSIHTLNPGKNSISIKAFDREKYIASESDILEITTNYKIEKKPNLYFLSIAVSDYKDSAYNLKYTVSDVKEVEDIIKQKSKLIYENIHTFELHDKNVNLDNMSRLQIPPS